MEGLGETIDLGLDASAPGLGDPRVVSLDDGLGDLDVLEISSLAFLSYNKLLSEISFTVRLRFFSTFFDASISSFEMFFRTTSPVCLFTRSYFPAAFRFHANDSGLNSASVGNRWCV